MKLPGQLEAEYAVTGLRIALAGLLLLSGVVGCTVQTVRIDGAQVALPLIGTIGPQGWKPYAEELEGKLAAKDEQIENCENRLLTSNASVDLLEKELQDIAIAAEKRAMELERRRKQAEADKTRLAAEAARSQRRIDELNRLAREAAGNCEAPRELLDQLEGL